MKRCSKCQLEKELGEFFTNKGKPYTECKPCHTIRTKAWFAKNPEKRREYGRKHRKNRRPEDVRRYSMNWHWKNKEKKYAHSQVMLAIKRGAMKRLPCEVCGKKQTDGHHADYTKPLDVKWLCRLHHAGEHKRLKSL